MVKELIEKKLKKHYPNINFEIVIPRLKKFGNYSTNLAINLSKERKLPIEEVANEIINNINIHKDIIERIEVVDGFINFFLSKKYLVSIIKEIERKKEKYGCSNFGERKKVNIEFVSANPTGLLNVVNGRAAAVGDAISNLLSAIGYQVEKEYYINDVGHQIDVLVASVRARYNEYLQKEVIFPQFGYKGDDVKELGKLLVEKYQESLLNENDEKFKDIAVSYFVKAHKKDLEKFRVNFDRWFYESKLHKKNQVDKAIEILKSKNMIYEKDNALWFKSTLFYDDKDRVVVKEDGTTTYFASDIAYHIDKFNRGYDMIIDVLGPDHHGYIPRIKSFIKALGYDLEKLKIIIIQQVSLKESGKDVKMSKREGKTVFLKDLIDDIGVDAARYFFLRLSCDTPLEFDLDLARKESLENPVYYIQYAHARIASIIRNAIEKKINIDEKYTPSLYTEEEMSLLVKLEQYPYIVEVAAKKFAPHFLTKYLEELAKEFHSFYTKHRVISHDKDLSLSRIHLINAVKIVIFNGLKLLGISAPEKM
jgi:arginyl-tRNA synthetase